MKTLLRISCLTFLIAVGIPSLCCIVVGTEVGYSWSLTDPQIKRPVRWNQVILLTKLPDPVFKFMNSETLSSKKTARGTWCELELPFAGETNSERIVQLLIKCRGPAWDGHLLWVVQNWIKMDLSHHWHAGSTRLTRFCNVIHVLEYFLKSLLPK